MSNATCLIRFHLFCVFFRSVKDQLNLPHYLSLLKNTCVIQVVLDKWFPLTQAQNSWKHRLSRKAPRQAMLGTAPLATRAPRGDRTTFESPNLLSSRDHGHIMATIPRSPQPPALSAPKRRARSPGAPEPRSPKPGAQSPEPYALST